MRMLGLMNRRRPGRAAPKRLSLPAALAVVVIGCASSPGMDAGIDSGSGDSGGGGSDSGLVDSGTDSGYADASAFDSGYCDGGFTDAGCNCGCECPPEVCSFFPGEDGGEGTCECAV
jgi:hypothetical protein